VDGTRARLWSQTSRAPVLKSAVKSAAMSLPSCVAPTRPRILDGWRLVVAMMDSMREYTMGLVS